MTKKHRCVRTPYNYEKKKKKKRLSIRCLPVLALNSGYFPALLSFQVGPTSSHIGRVVQTFLIMAQRTVDYLQPRSWKTRMAHHPLQSRPFRLKLKTNGNQRLCRIKVAIELRQWFQESDQLVMRDHRLYRRNAHKPKQRHTSDLMWSQDFNSPIAPKWCAE